MSAVTVGRRRKIKKKKKTLAKRSNAVLSKNISKLHISNSFFENIILAYNIFYIRPHIPMDIISFFFNSRISGS